MSSVYKFNVIKELSPSNKVFDAINAQDLLCKLIECKSVTPDTSLTLDILADVLSDIVITSYSIHYTKLYDFTLWHNIDMPAKTKRWFICTFYCV